MTDIKILLREELYLMQQTADIFNYSYKKSKKIRMKKKFSDTELEALDSFTSRFARLSDLITQKMFRLIEQADLEDGGTTRDRINRAEKKGLISSADSFIEVRKLRNTIAHEYVRQMKEVIEKSLEFSPILLQSVELIKLYCKKNYGV